MSSIIDLTVSDTDSVIDLCSDFEYESSDSDVEYINVDQVQSGYVSDAGIEEFVNLFGVHQDNQQHLPPLDKGLMDELALVEQKEDLGLLPPLEEAVLDFDFDFDAYIKPNTVAQYTGRSQKRAIQLADTHVRYLKRQKV